MAGCMSKLIGPTSHTFISQRLRLHYLDWGNRGKPPLLLVHGGRDHARSWDWTANALREDYHVVAMDHRGHGDSEWVSDGIYEAQDMIYDVAQLVHQLDLAPVTIVAHSMGGDVSLRYAGTFPEQVRKIVSVEGLGPRPEMIAKRDEVPLPERVREWIGNKRKASGRSPRRYASIEEAFNRMIEENSYLTEDQARHLTIHGVNQNEDGTYSWKFDPHLNVWPVSLTSTETLASYWQRITCPMLLLTGKDSWLNIPADDARLKLFNDLRFEEFENAGHWLHHDQFDRFIKVLREFL